MFYIICCAKTYHLKSCLSKNVAISKLCPQRNEVFGHLSGKFYWLVFGSVFEWINIIVKRIVIQTYDFLILILFSIFFESVKSSCLTLPRLNLLWLMITQELDPFLYVSHIWNVVFLGSALPLYTVMFVRRALGLPWHWGWGIKGNDENILKEIKVW